MIDSKIEPEMKSLKEGENNSEITRSWLPMVMFNDKATTSSKTRISILTMKLNRIQYIVILYRVEARLSTDAMKVSSMMHRTLATRQMLPANRNSRTSPPLVIGTNSKLHSNSGKVLARFAHWSRQAEKSSTKKICLQTLNFMIEVGKLAHLIIMAETVREGIRSCSQSHRTTSLTRMKKKKTEYSKTLQLLSLSNLGASRTLRIVQMDLLSIKSPSMITLKGRVCWMKNNLIHPRLNLQLRWDIKLILMDVNLNLNPFKPNKTMNQMTYRGHLNNHKIIFIVEFWSLLNLRKWVIIHNLEMLNMNIYKISNSSKMSKWSMNNMNNMLKWIDFSHQMLTQMSMRNLLMMT